MDYSQAGVDIELGDEASKILYEASKKTWANRVGKVGEVIVPNDDFSGARVMDVSNLPEGSFMCIGFDGVGTKVELAERMGHHETVAYDLFATVCDDAVVRGGEPVVIGSILDLNTLGRKNDNYIKFIRELADGYVKAAKEANVAVLNGEMAELSTRISGYGPFNYNWGSGLIWFASKNRLLTGKEIQPGHKVVSLREKGFRSNGLSLARKAFEQKYGEDWHTQELEGQKLGDLVLTPSQIYCKLICEMNGGFSAEPKVKVTGVVHITGGGIPSKLGRVLRPSGFGAKLDNLFVPAKVVLHAQEVGGVSDEEAYRTWCMGQGMLVITPEPEKVIEIAATYGIDAQVAGEITEKPGITIASKGIEGRELKF